jgi:hypothetical protein
MKTVAILCARADSGYKALPHADVYDAARDARSFPGGLPVVAHPPCRLWGRMFAFARCADPAAEKALGVWCAEQVRANGGILEHPIGSRLWAAAGLPRPGQRDAAGGFTVAAPQGWFGHRAEKWSWFYVCGIEPLDLPVIPFKMGEASHVISSSSHRRGRSKGTPNFRPGVTKAEREATPPALATWLIETAHRCARSLVTTWPLSR